MMFYCTDNNDFNNQQLKGTRTMKQKKTTKSEQKFPDLIVYYII